LREGIDLAEKCFIAAFIIAFIGFMFWISDKHVKKCYKEALGEKSKKDGVK
jgi:cbb3-type cytochrome oxidase subunit 3